jgi:hypothetical protein
MRFSARTTLGAALRLWRMGGLARAGRGIAHGNQRASAWAVILDGRRTRSMTGELHTRLNKTVDWRFKDRRGAP